MKWTFSQFGGKGYFRIPTSVENEVVKVATTNNTSSNAYSLMRMRTAELGVEQTNKPRVVTDADGNSVVTLRLKTSDDVASLVVTDENGNVIPSHQIECVANQLDEDVVEWTVTITTSEAGTYTYLVTGAYENGYTDNSKTVKVVVTVENPPNDVQPDDDNNGGKSFLDIITGIYSKLIEFFRQIFALFGISI
jgi:hypothetical protein